MQSSKYIYSRDIPINAGQSVKFLAKTNGSTVIFNPMVVSSDTVPIEIRLIENPTFSDTGVDTVTGHNISRQTSDVHTVVMYSNPTTPATVELIGGELLFEGLGHGTVQSGADTSKPYNFVLKENEFYLYMITNTSVQDAVVSVDFAWTEIPK
jgi:hypothetical protein